MLLQKQQSTNLLITTKNMLIKLNKLVPLLTMIKLYKLVPLITMIKLYKLTLPLPLTFLRTRRHRRVL